MTFRKTPCDCGNTGIVIDEGIVTVGKKVRMVYGEYCSKITCRNLLYSRDKPVRAD